MTDDEAAVLDAAGKWVKAKEAILAVDDACLDDLARRADTERAPDQAESELTEAVYRVTGREQSFPRRD
jgi:hypothetical protein